MTTTTLHRSAALLCAGAIALLAGCGKENVPNTPAEKTEAAAAQMEIAASNAQIAASHAQARASETIEQMHKEADRAASDVQRAGELAASAAAAASR